MSQWEPGEYHSDPTVNALLNIAAGLHAQAEATRHLLYGLKYSQGEGMSIAEAIEVGARSLAESGQALASAIEDLK